jgi:signal peptide peptidase-like protein 2B
VKIPFFGAVPYLTLAVTPFCIVFAVVWAVKRHASYAWIGQDILVRIFLLMSLYLIVKICYRLLILLSIFLMTVIQGIALIITVLQIVRIPNLKV